jgi:hypothetical protein
MPRLATNDYQRVISKKKGTLEEYIDYYKYSDQYMADKLGIHIRTFQKKKNHVEQFNSVELAKLNIILNIPRKEWI